MDRSTIQHARSLLLDLDIERLLDLCQSDRRYWWALRLILNESDEIRWPAIEAAGGLMERWWQEGRQEKVRDYLRKLLWSLTDESGEIGWNAPQTVAEIAVRIPELLEPYGIVAIARALHEPLLVDGGLWAAGRLGSRAGRAIATFPDLALGAFDSDDPETLGLAAWAVGEAGFAPAAPHLRSLEERTEPVSIHVCRQRRTQTLGQWASEALSKIGS
jgi:hypothetical protein